MAITFNSYVVALYALGSFGGFFCGWCGDEVHAPARWLKAAMLFLIGNVLSFGFALGLAKWAQWLSGP
jgi:hypothetical protein